MARSLPGRNCSRVDLRREVATVLFFKGHQEHALSAAGARPQLADTLFLGGVSVVQVSALVLDNKQALIGQLADEVGIKIVGRRREPERKARLARNIAHPVKHPGVAVDRARAPELLAFALEVGDLRIVMLAKAPGAAIERRARRIALRVEAEGVGEAGGDRLRLVEQHLESACHAHGADVADAAFDRLRQLKARADQSGKRQSGFMHEVAHEYVEIALHLRLGDIGRAQFAVEPAHQVAFGTGARHRVERGLSAFGARYLDLLVLHEDFERFR